MTVADIIDPTQALDAPYIWNSLPRTPELAKETLMFVLGGNVFWFFMFFVGCYVHPLPAKFAAKMSAYDKLVLRHRLICIYHGAIALTMGVYWHIFYRDNLCSR